MIFLHCCLCVCAVTLTHVPFISVQKGPGQVFHCYKQWVWGNWKRSGVMGFHKMSKMLTCWCACPAWKLCVSWCCEVQSVSWAEARGRETGQRRDCPDSAPGFGLVEAGFPLNTQHTTPGETQWRDGLKMEKFQEEPKIYCHVIQDYFFIFSPASLPHTFSCWGHSLS